MWVCLFGTYSCIGNLMDFILYVFASDNEPISLLTVRSTIPHIIYSLVVSNVVITSFASGDSMIISSICSKPVLVLALFVVVVFGLSIPKESKFKISL